MGASCQGPKQQQKGQDEPPSRARQKSFKLDFSLTLPVTTEQRKKSTISLAVPAPILYGSRRFRFAGRSCCGYSGSNILHRNQDNFFYYNLKRFDLHLFGILDGNGPDGDLAAFFVKEKLLLQMAKMASEKAVSISKMLEASFAHVDGLLAGLEDIDVANSGATLVVLALDENGATVANCGDCRAIFGQKNLSQHKCDAKAISTDHTLRIASERDRCANTGALIQTMAQFDGTVPLDDDQCWDLDIGAEIDTSGDPPRLFEQNSKLNRPAVAFTRAVGCSIAKTCGVIATPYINHIAFDSCTKFLILGSNGVFEFLTNQEVVNMTLRAKQSENHDGKDGDRRTQASTNSILSKDEICPAAACEALVEHAYRAWWQMEKQVDDITVIVIAIDILHHSTNADRAPSRRTKQNTTKLPKPQLSSSSQVHGTKAQPSIKQTSQIDEVAMSAEVDRIEPPVKAPCIDDVAIPQIDTSVAAVPFCGEQDLDGQKKHTGEGEDIDVVAEHAPNVSDESNAPSSNMRSATSVVEVDIHG